MGYRAAAACASILTGRSFFKTLVDREVTVELKNDMSLRGTLKSVDQYLNIKLDDVTVLEEFRWPHLVGLMVLATADMQSRSWCAALPGGGGDGGGGGGRLAAALLMAGACRRRLDTAPSDRVSVPRQG